MVPELTIPGSLVVLRMHVGLEQYPQWEGLLAPHTVNPDSWSHASTDLFLNVTSLL